MKAGLIRANAPPLDLCAKAARRQQRAQSVAEQLSRAAQQRSTLVADGLFGGCASEWQRGSGGGSGTAQHRASGRMTQRGEPNRTHLMPAVYATHAANSAIPASSERYVGLIPSEPRKECAALHS